MADRRLRLKNGVVHDEARLVAIGDVKCEASCSLEHPNGDSGVDPGHHDGAV